MSYKIAFFGAKPYDIASFDKVNEKYNYDIKYFKGHLNPNNVVLTQGADAVCIFVNDTADAAVIDAMADIEVKLIRHARQDCRYYRYRKDCQDIDTDIERTGYAYSCLRCLSGL